VTGTVKGKLLFMPYRYVGELGLEIPYILESNPHTFYSFRGLKNQMWIRITCGLDSQS